jgi:hypothetical protein
MASRRAEAWFEAGAAAVHRFASYLEGHYACPLCARLFGRTALYNGTLTEEHTPPQSVGGQPLCLTCKSCNNTAGYTLEPHVRRHENLAEVFIGNMADFRPAWWESPSGTANVEFRLQNGTLSVRQNPKQNSPAAREQFDAHVSRLANLGPAESWGVRLTPFRDAYNPWLLDLARLRSAYLAAFAAFGYRYVFHPRVLVVRKQLFTPTKALIRGFGGFVHGAGREARRLVIVEEPAALRGLLVQLGNNLVMLPWHDDALYDRVPAFARRFASLKIRGKVVPWPDGPRHEADFPRIV